uniref:Phosphatidylethanolamine-binding protein 4 n=1 Tax=Strix occidentalis caurina TaxID=311401 RepID=A0A8D0EVW5_STROC
MQGRVLHPLPSIAATAQAWLGRGINTHPLHGVFSPYILFSPSFLPRGDVEIIYPELGDVGCTYIPKCHRYRRRISREWGSPRVRYPQADKGADLRTGDIKGHVLTDYTRPTPPPRSGYHRYQLRLYEQPAHQAIALSPEERVSLGKEQPCPRSRPHAVPPGAFPGGQGRRLPKRSEDGDKHPKTRRDRPPLLHPGWVHPELWGALTMGEDPSWWVPSLVGAGALDAAAHTARAREISKLSQPGPHERSSRGRSGRCVSSAPA